MGSEVTQQEIGSLFDVQNGVSVSFENFTSFYLHKSMCGLQIWPTFYLALPLYWYLFLEKEHNVSFFVVSMVTLHQNEKL